MLDRATEKPNDGWQDWPVATWSERLFDALFVGEDPSHPVTHVPATALDLRRVTGDDGADPEAVAAAFVRALTKPPNVVREWLSVRSEAFYESWVEPDRLRAPEYFAYLVLTCYAAAGGEEETIGVGRFSERFRSLLRHRVSEGYPYFDGLNDLWKAFRAWVARHAERGRCRPLVLPPEDSYRTRIGYSYALASPTLRDRRTMATLFADLQGEEPGLGEAVRRVRERRGEFDGSSRLLVSFDDFVDRYHRNDFDLGAHPFWTAVRDATSLEYSPESRARLRLGLVMPEPGALGAERPLRLVCSAPPGGAPPSRVTLEPVEGGVGGFASVVRIEGVRDPVEYLLDPSKPLRWKAVSSTPLATSVRRGVLLFARDEKGWPVTRHSLPEPGRPVWLLARENVVGRVLLRAFRRLPPEARPRPRPSLYRGWEWAGPFDAGELLDLGGHFADIQCLQPSARGPALRLVGGVRVGAAYLGDPAVRPLVVSGVAEAVRRVDGESGPPRPLVGDGKGTFRDTSGDALRGEVSFVAADGDGREVGRRRVRFVREPIYVDYKAPSSPASLTAEGAGEETVGWDAALASTEGGALYPYAVGAPEVAGGNWEVRFDRLLATDPWAAPATVPEGETWTTLNDVAAALAGRRTGLGEGEFLSLMTDLAGVPEGPLMWEAARAWVEAGAFDVLTPTSWTNRTYVARRPQLVTWDGGRAVSLVGLVPSSLRGRVAALAADVGAAEVTAPSPSPWVPAVPSFRVSDPAAVEELARRAELEPVGRLRPWGEVLVDPVAVVAATAEAPPPGYAPAGHWDWESGRFVRTASAEGASLVRYDHPRDASRYVVSDGGRTRSFRSRTWAFLVALALRGEPAFAYDESGRLRGVGRTHAHLPVPIARALACVAGSPGPLTDGDGRARYVVPTTPEARRALDREWFGRVRGVPAPAARVARRILLWADRSTGPTVPVPPRLALALAPYVHDPAVAAVAGGRVPPALVPHVVKLAAALRASSS